MTGADRKRLESAIVSAQIHASGGLSYCVQGAADLALKASLGAPLDPKASRYLRACLARVVRRELGHVRRGRESARSFREPEPGTYGATQTVAEREELAGRMTRDEPKHVREARAALRLRKVVAGLRARATEEAR